MFVRTLSEFFSTDTDAISYLVLVRTKNVLQIKGGFECYIEADDGNNGKSSGAGGGDSGGGPADEYNEDDDTELLSISASNNTLSLVFRDPGTMRFVKYVSYSAPSSRYDICMEYNVPPGPPEDDEENDDEEEADVGF